MPENTNTSLVDTLQKFSIPLAIVIAGALIAGAVFYGGGSQGGNFPPPQPGVVLEPVRGVQSDDHVLGSRAAKVVIVEYSDFECPFCKMFHETMHQIIDEYGQSGEVAWVYRQSPLDILHSKARKESEASECAAELGANDAFWKFADKVFEITPSNDGLDIGTYNPGGAGGGDAGKLSDIALETGLDKAAFEACLASGRHAERVQRDLDEVGAAGGGGTPHSILIVGDEQIAVEGALPFESIPGQTPGMQEIIDAILDRGSGSVADAYQEVYSRY